MDDLALWREERHEEYQLDDGVLEFELMIPR